jgi:hypothetical protein
VTYAQASTLACRIGETDRARRRALVNGAGDDAQVSTPRSFPAVGTAIMLVILKAAPACRRSPPGRRGLAPVRARRAAGRGGRAGADGNSTPCSCARLRRCWRSRATEARGTRAVARSPKLPELSPQATALAGRDRHCAGRDPSACCVDARRSAPPSGAAADTSRRLPPPAGSPPPPARARLVDSRERTRAGASSSPPRRSARRPSATSRRASRSCSYPW